MSPTETGPTGICLAPGRPYCGASVDDLDFGDAFNACHTAPGTSDGAFVPWPQGDCDGDGTINGMDEDPCSPPPDAGTGTDAGTGGTDAGTGDTDAGDRDGGSAPMDGSTATTPGFGGGGGCVCRAAPVGRGGLGLTWLAALGLIGWARRRRA